MNFRSDSILQPEEDAPIISITEEIEKWIATEEAPQLRANESQIEYFKNEENFEIFLLFIMDPKFYTPNIELWVSNTNFWYSLEIKVSIH